MSLLKTIEPSEATGVVKEIYNNLEESFQKVPNVMKMYSANPHWLIHVSQFLKYYEEHPVFEPEYFCYMRIIVAKFYGGEYCVRLNSSILNYLGITEEKLEEIKRDITKVNLSNEKIELLKYTVKIATEPEKCRDEEIQKLRELGWDDKDIFDSIFNAVTFSGYIKLVKTLKVEIDF